MNREVLNSIREVASHLANTLRTIYVDERVIEPIEQPEPLDCLRLSLFEKKLMAEGFRLLGDYADRTLESLGESQKIRYRVMSHPNSTYCLQYIFEGQRVFEFGNFPFSLKADSIGLSTTNAWASRHLDDPKGWNIHYITPDKTWKELWDWHLQRLDASFIQGKQFEKIESLEKFIEFSLKRVQKEQFERQQIPGLVREGELQAYLEQPKDIRKMFYNELKHFS